MLSWLRSLLGMEKRPSRPMRLRAASTEEAPARPPPAQPRMPAQPEPFEISDELTTFLIGLVTPRTPADLQELPQDDRRFLSGIMKMLSENRFEVPILPRTALEISRLMSNPLSSTKDFVKVLKSDPALSIRVLRVANSAYYGFAYRTTDLRDAVFRIGLNQLRTSILFTHLQGKILQGSYFGREVKWLSDVSTALAHLAQALAPDLGIPQDDAFTRGMLMHLEHFVILGMLPEVARENKTRLRPSTECLWEAISRFGWQVRGLSARQWGLEGLLLADDPESAALRLRYDELQRSLIVQWTGLELPLEVEGVPSERLTRALSRIDPQAVFGETIL